MIGTPVVCQRCGNMTDLGLERCHVCGTALLGIFDEPIPENRFGLRAMVGRGR